MGDPIRLGGEGQQAELQPGFDRIEFDRAAVQDPRSGKDVRDAVAVIECGDVEDGACCRIEVVGPRHEGAFEARGHRQVVVPVRQTVRFGAQG